MHSHSNEALEAFSESVDCLDKNPGKSHSKNISKSSHRQGMERRVCASTAHDSHAAASLQGPEADFLGTNGLEKGREKCEQNLSNRNPVGEAAS